MDDTQSCHEESSSRDIRKRTDRNTLQAVNRAVLTQIEMEQGRHSDLAGWRAYLLRAIQTVLAKIHFVRGQFHL